MLALEGVLLEELGVRWPGGEVAILGLLAASSLAAAVHITIERRGADRRGAALRLGEVTR